MNYSVTQLSELIVNNEEKIRKLINLQKQFLEPPKSEDYNQKTVTDLNHLINDVILQLQVKLKSFLVEKSKYSSSDVLKFVDIVETPPKLDVYLNSVKMVSSGIDTDKIIRDFSENTRDLISISKSISELKKKSPADFDKLYVKNIESKAWFDMYEESIVIFSKIIGALENTKTEAQLPPPDSLNDYIQKIKLLKSGFEKFKAILGSQDTRFLSKAPEVTFNEKYEPVSNINQYLKEKYGGENSQDLQDYVNSKRDNLDWPHLAANPNVLIAEIKDENTIKNCYEYLLNVIATLPPEVNKDIIKNAVKKEDVVDIDLISLFRMTFETILASPYILKLQSLDVTLIIERFLGELAGIEPSVKYANFVMLFMAAFYIDVSLLHNGISYKEAPSVLSETSLVGTLNLSYNYVRRLDVDGTNFNKFVNVLKLKDIIITPQDKTRKVLFITTFLQIIDTICDQREKRHPYVVFIINLIKRKLFEDIILFFNVFLFKATPTIYNLLDTTIIKSTPPVITYIKVRIDPINGKISEYNKRFNAQVNSKVNTLILSYNDDNFPYYKQDLQQGELPKYDSKLYKRLQLINSVVESESDKRFITDENMKPEMFDVANISENLVQRYNNNFVIGPVTKIFHPELLNSEISQNLVDLQALLDDGKTVLMLGYGASGAGKTSSLIYFNQGETEEQRNGILINLCNIMAKKGYDELTVRAAEFYTNKKKNDVNKPVIRRLGQTAKEIKDEVTTYKSIAFYYDKDNAKTFVLKESYSHTNEFIDRIKTDDPNGPSCAKNQKNPKCITTTFKVNTVLGELLTHIIDNDRYVKATTNNPNSSRSHTLIAITFNSTDPLLTKKPCLVIGDFAGVENTFECKSIDNLRRFINIRVKPGSPLYFYEEYSVAEKESTVVAKGGSLKKKNIKGGTVIAGTGCTWGPGGNAEDMYTFDKEKFLKPTDTQYDGYFMEFPKMYTTMENIILDGYSVPDGLGGEQRVNIEAITEKMLNQIKIAEAAGYSDIAVKNMMMALELQKKTIFEDYTDATGKIFLGLKTKAALEDFKYDDNAREDLIKGEIAKNKIPDSDFAAIEEIRKRITSCNAMAANFASFFELLGKISLLKGDDNQKIVAFVKQFLAANKKGYLSQWMEYKQLYSVLASNKDLIDKAPAYGKIKPGFDSYTHYPSKIMNFFDLVHNALQGRTVESALSKDPISRKMVKYIYKKERANGKLNNNTWFNDEPARATSPPSTRGSVTTNPVPLTTFTTDPAVRASYGYREIAIKDKQGVETFVESYPIKSLEIMIEGKPFLWEQWDINEQYIPEISGGPLVELWPQDATNFVPEYNALSKKGSDKLTEYYENILKKIFGPASPTGGDDQAEKFINTLEEPFNKFWSTFTSENPSPFTIFYQDPVTLVYNYTSMWRDKLIKDEIAEAIGSNKILKEVVGLKNIVINSIESILNFMNTLELWNSEYEVKAKALNQPQNEEQWATLIKAINKRIPDLLYGFMCKYPLSYDICSLRRTEGLFINDSLQKVREFIKSLLDFKLESSLYPVPLFQNYCLKNDYCVTGKCFPSEKHFTSGDITQHVIIKELMNLTGLTNANDISIGIFCVLNLSLGANNPPPIPYIDLNNVKKSIERIKSLPQSASADLTRGLVREMAFEVEKLIYNVEFGFNGPFTATLQPNGSIVTIPSGAESGIEDKTANLRKDPGWAGFRMKYKEFVTPWGVVFDPPWDISTINDDEVEQNKKMLFESRIYVPPSDDFKKDTGGPIQAFYDKAVALFNIIDKTNAASAIGTLEFVDQLSKYYNVKWICQVEEGNKTTPENIRSILNDGELYDIASEKYKINFAQKGGIKKKLLKKVKKSLKKKSSN
jgi:hypothetical protein